MSRARSVSQLVGANTALGNTVITGTANVSGAATFGNTITLASNTGIVLPVGTTAQRSATTGSLRLNSNTQLGEVYNGNSWSTFGDTGSAYTHIRTWAPSTTHTGQIYFNNIFSNNYTSYKVIFGWLGFASDNNELYMRITDQSGNMLTSTYYGVSLFSSYLGSGSDQRVNTNNGVEITMWTNGWGSSLDGGIHGEMNIYNVTAPVVGGTDTNRGTYYRPIWDWSLMGYDTNGYGYSISKGFGRYNLSNDASGYGGFCLYQPAYANFPAKGYISVYGVRSPTANTG
jgi:hypothetical protein